MRRRVVIASVVVAALTAVLLGAPLAVAGALLQQQRHQERVDDAARNLGQALDARLANGEQVRDDLVARAPDDLYAEVRLANGTVWRAGTRPPGSALRAAYTATDGSTVTVLGDRGVVQADVARAVALVIVVAVVAIGAAIAVGMWQGRRLAAPLQSLAREAVLFGSGETPTVPPPTGIEEVDRLAGALVRSTERVSSLLAAERQFARDASHQLRTPLTALSMRLEEIMSSDDIGTSREEAKSALLQVERLTTVVEHLLDTVRGQRASTQPLKVDEIVVQQLTEWEPAFEAAGRRIETAGQSGLVAMATPGGLSQVLATLLENSLRHGDGTVTIRTRSTGISVVIEVGDQGKGVPAELGARIFERSVSGGRSTGLGLAVARQLATADGGRLELLQQRPAVFALFLSAPATGPG